MEKIKHRLLFLVICCVVNLTAAFNNTDKFLNTEASSEMTYEETILLPPSATISGTATVCLNDTPLPEVTFTGSGGQTPYTFVYTINNGPNLNVSTTGTNTSVTVNVNTNVVGDFVYEIVSVTDNTNDTTLESGTVTIIVGAPPTVDFTFDDNECSGTPVHFLSNITGSSPFIYAWTFGDASTSTDQDPTHVYDARGCGFSNFIATLTVTDSNGCSASASQTINVEQRPDLSFVDLDAQFTPPFDNCGNNTVDPAYTINVGNTSPSDSCVTSYDIDWGDGNAATGILFPITHTYAGLGSFNMVITGYGDSGCNTTETILVKNSSNPIGAIISPGNTVNLCLPINALDFAIGSWGANPPDTTYSVDYGDGNTGFYTQDQLIAGTANYDPNNPAAADPFPIPHEYTESSCPNSSYTITLIISTSCGQTFLTAGPIIILKLPEVDFDYESPGCVDTAIQFTNLTEGGFGPNCTDQAAHMWDFGDGDTSTLENPSHVYTSPGTYTVTLLEENFCGTTDPVVKTICIEPELVPNFTLDTNSGCIPLDVVGTNTTDLSQSCGSDTYLWEVSYMPEFCGTTELWSFTNGTDETSVNPSFQFDTAGTYELSMTITNSCGDFTTMQTIEVKRPPTATINPIDDACGMASFNPVATVDTCAPASDTITYSWSFPGGTPATSNLLDPGTITYTMVGVYTVSLGITNACGTTTVTEVFVVSSLPTITNTDLTQTLCSGAESTAIDITSDNASTTYNWSSNTPAGLTGYIPNGTSSTIPAQTLINTTNTAVTLIYTVTPEINGCFGAPVNFEIVVEPAPLITTQPISDAVCQNGTANDLSVAFQGTGTANYQWYENTVDNTTTGTAIAGATFSTFTPPTDTVGTIYYYVIITFSTGGCNEITSDTAEIIVANTTQIDMQPLNTQSICEGGTSEELSITVSGGAGVASYQWFSNTTNSNTGGTLITGATAPNYTPPAFTSTGNFYYYVEVSYITSGCAGLTSDVSEIIVVNDPTITIQPLVFQSLCQNTSTQNLEVTIADGLGIESYQWYVSTVNNTTTGTAIVGATASIFTPPSTVVGTLYYYCIVTQDVSGCEVTSASSEVEVTAGAQFNSQPISDELCLGETTNTLTVSYTNGTGTPSYQWYQNTVNNTTTGTTITGANIATYNPDVSSIGTLYYYMIITFNSGGCTEIISNTAEIIVNEIPIIDDSEALICSGNTFVFIPDTTNTGDIVPLNTLYTWTLPVVNPAGSITGATEQLTPIATVSQFLENTTTNPATVTYTVTPISGNCIGINFDVVVTVNPSISVTSTVVNNTCFQSNDASINITIVGGVPFTTGNPYTVNWTGPNGYTSTDEDISNLEAGIYTLDIIDDGGCPYTETFTITEPEELMFSFIDFDPETISCFGANDGDISIDIAGGTQPYDYTWTLGGLPFSTDEDLTNLGPGDYAISVTDTNSCGPITLNFVIVEPELFEVTLDTKTDVLCFGEATGTINVAIVGGRLDYTFSWTGPNGFVSANQNIDTLFAGTYNLTVTDRSGCTDMLEVEIIQNDQIDIDVTATDILCYGDNDASITINSISGGVSPYGIAWSNFGTGNVQTNLSPGTYTITITDAENCTRSFPIVIDAPPLFLIDPVVMQMSCSGENDASITLNFVGGIDPVTVVWDDDATAGTERNNLAPGNYSVTITDGTPCVIQESFTIFNILPLELSANVTDALDCDDTNSGAINLLIQGGTPPFTVVWSNGDTTEDLDNVPPNSYTANVTDANGCEIQGNWDVIRFEPLVLNIETQTEVDCDAKTVDQTFVAMASGGVPPFQFNWSSGTVSGTNNELMTIDEDGLVLLEVIDSQGCTANYSLNVEAPVLGDPDFTTSSFGFINYGVYAIQDPIEFINTTTGDYESILWDFGDGSFSSEENPIHTYIEIGSYIVTQRVTYPFGCVYEKVITLIIEEGYRLIMPNAFTPNDDTLNDFFSPVHIGLNTLEINVYDTWGSLIYSESGDTIRGWDGKVKNEVAENGNYYYTFTAKTFYGNVIKKQGAFVYIK
ncbi:PKD domain-containing protein [Winogradskyella sp.]|uniref:PKD domain-containing protein n=1 Tax=Winogradskyella sp. TaxID=1883156 RepID=UPI0025F1BA68|nr:PKD domain-containing protein [Winogradskyella sp.]